MKRSEVNKIIKHFENVINEHKFALPPFCNWTPEDWQDKGHEYDEIRDNMLGWDVTDYAEGDFAKTGLALVTIRNGNHNNPKYSKTYAEKLLLIEENQICPMHFHFSKMEDIINRGGGNLMIEVYNSTPEGKLADTDVTLCTDGHEYMVPAGTVVKLEPGQSITLYKGLYHKFYGEPGHGPVFIGEVSMCNDDNNDNRFHTPLSRFSKIEEDEAPYRLLCNEYPIAK